MIAQLQGKIVAVKAGFVVVDVCGVGYKVFVSAYTLGKVAGMGDVLLYVHTYVREDILALYGFLAEDELTMFELLIGVSGIGPKAALGILSIADPATVRTAVLNRDPSILTKVSGVGKKTAERVIIELQNKVEGLQIKGESRTLSDQEAIEALMSIGYSVTEARESLKMVPTDVKDIGERVRFALKQLGKK